MHAGRIAVVNCEQLVTLAGPARPRIRGEMSEISIVPQAAMLIRDGVIEKTGPQSALVSEISSDYEIVDAGGRVVLPGFVDAHAHPVFAGTRVDEFELRAKGATYEEIAAAGGGIRSTVRKTRAASEDDLLGIAKQRSGWFLRCGTTTLEAKSGYGLSLDGELKILRVIQRLRAEGPLRYAATFLGAHEIPDEYRGRRAEYVNLVADSMLPRVHAEQLAEFCDVFCEPSVFDVAASGKVLSAAKAMGFGLRIHADQLTHSGGARLASELGANTADHLEQVDKDDIQAMAAARVQPVLLPASVYSLGRNRYPPAREMIESGLAVVLATDFNPGSSPTPSIPFILSLAATQMRMSPAEAVTAVTINAAHSLGRGDQVGSLEARKYADFVIHDCRDYREIGYFAGIEPTHSVYIGGTCVYRRSADA